MTKKDPFKFTIKFNEKDPVHRLAVKRLLTLDNSKATYLASLIVSDMDKYGLLEDIKALPEPVSHVEERPKTSQRDRRINAGLHEKMLSVQPSEAQTHDDEPVTAAAPFADVENENIIAATLGMFGMDEED